MTSTPESQADYRALYNLPFLSKATRASQAALGRTGKRPLLLATLLLILCVVVVQWSLLSSGKIPITMDTLSYFYPVNGLTGSLLHSGKLPVWSPHQMSGMPLMGDPQSGWGSLTTMLSYAILPLPAATAVNSTVLMALAAIGMLGFLRSTGVGVTGATLAALSYGLSTFTFTAQYSPVHLGMHAWLPWLLLGVDVSVRGRGRRRLLGWALAGFAASQILSIWLGQGAYYAFAAAAAYTTFLTLIGGPSEGKPALRRLGEFGMHSVMLTLLTVGLSAWTVFPRLELLFVSNLRGGYDAGEEQIVGGSDPGILLSYFTAGVRYMGAAALVLIVAALVLHPNRAHVFYAGMAALAYGLSTTWLVNAASASSLLRSALDAAPGMLELHLHSPGRIAFVYFFFAAALAGVGLDKLLAARGRWRYALPVACACLLLCILVFRGLAGLSSPAFTAFYLGLAIVVALVLLAWSGRLPVRASGVLLLALTAGELIHSASVYGGENDHRYRPEPFLNSAEIQASAALLSSRPQARFFTYDPETLKVSSNGYRNFRRKKRISRLLGNTQATVYRLEDVQGYNPLHLASYDKLLTVANGRPHRIYRDAYVRFRALDSPLLDMLNARYVLTPEGTRMAPKYRRVPGVQGPWLYENTQALPRTWAVHRTAVYDDDTALRLIDGGEVDLRQVAVVSRPISGLQPQLGAERVVVTDHRADRVEISADLSAPGLVVLSELDYPAWKVKVDGDPRPVVRANGALRAVEAPAGTHTITWYYSSMPTTLGFLLSGLTLLGIFAILAAWSYHARSR